MCSYVYWCRLCILTANLGITGTTNVSDNRWSVHFVKDSIVGKQLAAVEVKEPIVDLNKLGDVYESSVNITNDGTIDVMLGDFSKIPETVPNYLIYNVTWVNDIEPQKNDALKVDDTLTLNVKVKYKLDIDSVPKDVEPLILSISLSYVQADENARIA